MGSIIQQKKKGILLALEIILYYYLRNFPLLRVSSKFRMLLRNHKFVILFGGGGNYFDDFYGGVNSGPSLIIIVFREYLAKLHLISHGFLLLHYYVQVLPLEPSKLIMPDFRITLYRNRSSYFYIIVTPSVRYKCSCHFSIKVTFN